MTLLLFVSPVFAEIPPVNLNVIVSGKVKDTIVTLIGYTSPSAFVTVQEDGNVVATFSANNSGGFNRSIGARTAGTHTYNMFATDGQNRTTLSYGFVLNLVDKTETIVSNILLPTTIDVSVAQRVNVSGSATPNSQITIFIHSDPVIETLSVGSSGNWSRNVVARLSRGDHRVYARVTLPGGLQSINSQSLNFSINCKTADLNCDGRVDLGDFSTLMHYWGTNNSLADINSDGIVDLADFSTMMHYWDG